MHLCACAHAHCSSPAGFRSNGGGRGVVCGFLLESLSDNAKAPCLIKHIHSHTLAALRKIPSVDTTSVVVWLSNLLCWLPCFGRLLFSCEATKNIHSSRTGCGQQLSDHTPWSQRSSNFWVDVFPSELLYHLHLLGFIFEHWQTATRCAMHKPFIHAVKMALLWILLLPEVKMMGSRVRPFSGVASSTWNSTP